MAKFAPTSPTLRASWVRSGGGEDGYVVLLGGQRCEAAGGEDALVMMRERASFSSLYVPFKDELCAELALDSVDTNCCCFISLCEIRCHQHREDRRTLPLGVRHQGPLCCSPHHS